MTIRIARVYDQPDPDDGYRVLADRLWPRGLARDQAAIDLWAKDVAPSTDLRRWFHAGGPVAEFTARYEAELAAGPGAAALAALRADIAGRDTVTLLTAACEPHVHVEVLRRLLLATD